MSQSEHAKINGNKCEIPHLDYYFYGRFGEIWLSIILCKNRHRLLAQLMIKSRAILHGVNRNIAWECEREKSQTLNWLDEICGLMSGYKRAIGNKWYWTVTKKKKICIPPYKMIKLGKWLCHRNMRTILWFEEFPHGSNIGLVLQRPKLAS